MTVRRMKSDKVNKNWADTLQFVRTGGTVIVEHYNKPIATIAPYEEPAVIETMTYTRTTDEGIETTTIARNGEQVSEVYKVDGETVDDSIVADSNADEYLRNRDMELRSEGYVLA